MYIAREPCVAHPLLVILLSSNFPLVFVVHRSSTAISNNAILYLVHYMLLDCGAELIDHSETHAKLNARGYHRTHNRTSLDYPGAGVEGVILWTIIPGTTGMAKAAVIWSVRAIQQPAAEVLMNLTCTYTDPAVRSCDYSSAFLTQSLALPWCGPRSSLQYDIYSRCWHHHSLFGRTRVVSL